MPALLEIDQPGYLPALKQNKKKKRLHSIAMIHDLHLRKQKILPTFLFGYRMT